MPFHNSRCLRQSLARQTRIWPLYFLASLDRAHAYVGNIELHGFYPLVGKLQPHRCSSYLMAMQATGLVASSSTRTGTRSRKAASPWVLAHPDIGHRYPFPDFPSGVVGRPVRKAVRTRCASEKHKTRSRLCFPTLSLPPRPPPLPPSLSLCYFLKYFLSLSIFFIYISIRVGKRGVEGVESEE